MCRLFAAPFVAAVVAFGTMLAAGVGGRIPTGLMSAWITVFNLMALGFAVAASRGPLAGRRSRRAWALLAGSIALLLACGFAFAAGLSDGALSRGEAMIGYAIRMATVPVMLVGVFTLPRHPLSRRQRHRFALDLTVVVIGGLMLMWHFLIGPALDQGVTGGSWLSVLFPLCDLTLIFGAGAVLLRGVASARRPLAFLIAGLCSFLLVDIMATRAILQINLNDLRLAWIGDYVMVAAMFLTAASAAAGAFAAWVPPPASGVRLSRCRSWLGFTRPAVSATQSVTLLPYLALGVGYLALVLTHLGDGLDRSDALVGGAIVLTGAVALRQMLAMRESHQLVITDSLTGLANRRRLRDTLDRAVEHARRTDGSVAVLLIDLDGFKEINDDLGHEAGDAVLVHFASVLGREVRRADTAARLGGDEFAVVAPGVSVDDASRLAQRVLDAAAVPVEVAGRSLRIRASIGVAVSIPGGTEARELLHRADLAMYRAKRQHTHTWQVHVDAEPAPRADDPVAPLA